MSRSFHADIEGAGLYLSYGSLGGEVVSTDAIVEHVETLPLDGVLGVLSLLTLDSVKLGRGFFEPKHQAPLFNRALVDDFPVSLPGVSKICVPGGLPRIGIRSPVFLHEQNLAWLTDLALRHANRQNRTPHLESIIPRICRLLLIANDHLKPPRTDSHRPRSLMQRRGVALNWLRQYQFNRAARGWTAWLSDLARQRKLMLDYLDPKYNIQFVDATAGMGLAEYFDSLAMFVALFAVGMDFNRRWMKLNSLCSKLGASRDRVERLVRSWSQTPTQYEMRVRRWKARRPGIASNSAYNFVPLKEAPLIEARPGELICPVIPFLLSKIVDGPYFILSDHLAADERKEFQKCLGKSFEDYAHDLAGELAARDGWGKWSLLKTNIGKKQQQASDSLIARYRTCVAFEHKALRPDTEFLSGAFGDRVVGPKTAILEGIDKGDVPVIENTSAKNIDGGVLTRGMWQQTKALPLILEAAHNAGQDQPKYIFPLIVHHANIRVCRVVRKAYLNPLIEAAGLYSDDLWQKPQWLHIGDLEALVALARKGKLRLGELLTHKHEHALDDDFHRYLLRQFDPTELVLPELDKGGIAALQNAQRLFASAAAPAD